jgi:hypothetical protein
VIALVRRVASIAVIAVLLPIEAEAQQAIFGYQLGLTESVGAIVSDDAQLVGTSTIQLASVTFNTGATLNLTLDILAQRVTHGFFAGVAFNQMNPTLVAELAPQQVRQPQSTLQANGGYLFRYEGTRSNGQLGASYQFGTNAQIPTTDPASGQQNVTTLPGTQFGPFSLNAQQHTVTGRALYQITRQRWDVDFAGLYTYASNGLYSLGAANAQPTAGFGVVPGQFIAATTHTVSPSFNYRQRYGARNQTVLNGVHSWTKPVRGEVLPGFGEAPIIPQSTQSTLGFQYLYSLETDRSYGAQVTGTFAMRVPTDNTGLPLLATDGNERGLTLDTFIYTAQATYSDRLRRADLRVTLTAGIAQARLYQPPFAQATNNYPFYDDAVISNIEPIGSIALERRFEPVDVSLNAGRTIAVGGLGASAVVTETANLGFRYGLELSMEYTLNMNLGFTASRIRGAGRELLPINPEAMVMGNAMGLAAIVGNNDTLGIGAGAQMPLFRTGGLSFDTSLNYNFLYNDPLAGQEPQPEPVAPMPGAIRRTISHNAFLLIRGTFGRGPLDQANDTRIELDAFSSDPRTGSPLTSARLLNQGRPLSEGTRGSAPGLPPEARRDSRQAYQVERSEERRTREQRENNVNAVLGSGDAEEDDRAARKALELEQKRPRVERAPAFDEIPPEELVRPLVTPSPETAPPPPPPPPPPEETEPEPEPKAEKKREKKEKPPKKKAEKPAKKKKAPAKKKGGKKKAEDEEIDEIEEL